MKKLEQALSLLPAMPVAVIATEAEGRLNFATHGQVGTVSSAPAIVYTSVIKDHKTASNIRLTNKFTLNIPPAAMLDKIVRCGMVSGNEEDKSGVFEIIRSEQGAPIISGSAVSMACEVVNTLELTGFYVFFGLVMETYVNGSCLRGEGDVPDTTLCDPLLCSADGRLWRVGEMVAAMGGGEAE